MAGKSGGSRKNTQSGNTSRKKAIHDAERTLLHNAMKQNGENRLSADSRGPAESVTTLGSNKRYNRYSVNGKPTKGNRQSEDNMINDAASIRKNRLAATKKSSGSGSGGSRSDAVKKAWITRKKNKG